MNSFPTESVGRITPTVNWRRAKSLTKSKRFSNAGTLHARIWKPRWVNSASAVGVGTRATAATFVNRRIGRRTKNIALTSVKSDVYLNLDCPRNDSEWILQETLYISSWHTDLLFCSHHVNFQIAIFYYALISFLIDLVFGLNTQLSLNNLRGHWFQMVIVIVMVEPRTTVIVIIVVMHRFNPPPVWIMLPRYILESNVFEKLFKKNSPASISEIKYSRSWHHRCYIHDN